MLYWFKVSYVGDKDVVHTDGILSADNYPTASKKLVDYYGDSIIELNLMEMEDVLETRDLWETMKGEHNDE